MKKLLYIDESTFITEEIDFSDEHFELAKNIHESYENEFSSKCTTLMINKDKKSLFFGVNLGDKFNDRVAYERGDNAYKVIIEKI